MLHLFKSLTSAVKAKRTVPTDFLIDEESIKLFQKEISRCEASLATSKKHLARVIAMKLIAKREDDPKQLEKLKLHEQNTQRVLENTSNTLRQYRSELNIALVANMIGNNQNTPPELSQENLTEMQRSLDRLRNRQNNAETLFG